MLNLKKILISKSMYRNKSGGGNTKVTENEDISCKVTTHQVKQEMNFSQIEDIALYYICKDKMMLIKRLG